MVIKGYDVWPLLKKTGKEIGEDKVTIYAAQMAYTLFFSLFPLILFAAALLSVVFDPQTVMRWISGNIATTLPPDVAGVLQKTVQSVVSVKGAPGILSFGLLTALWSGSAIFGSMTTALNAAYDVDEARPWWKKQLLRIAAMVVTGGVLIVASLVLLNGEGIIRWVGDRIGLGAAARTIWMILQYPIALALVVGALWLLYYFLPNTRDQDRSLVFVGAVITTMLWVIATFVFRIYVQNFHAVNPAYGAIGAIMLLLTWMFYTMFVFLAGGELNSELQQGTARVGPNASAPPPREEARARNRRKREESGAARSNGDGHRESTHFRRIAPPAVAPSELSKRGVTSFVRELVDDGWRLVKREIALARVEAARAFRAIGTGTILVTGGAVLALLGLLSLIASIVLVVGDQWLPNDLYWVAALVVTVVTGVAAYVFLRRGLDTLAPGATLRDTRRSLEEDRAWTAEELESLRRRAHAAVVAADRAHTRSEIP